MKNKNKQIVKIISLFIIIFTISIFSFHKANAADCDPKASSTSCYTLLSPLPGMGDKNGNVDVATGGMGSYINSIIKLFMGIVAALAVVMVIIGGMEYMISGGASEKTEGKDRIMNALFGLTLALVSWLILNTINPDLVTLTITMPSVNFTVIPESTGIACSNNYGSKIKVQKIVDGQTAGIVDYTLTLNGLWPSDNGIDQKVDGDNNTFFWIRDNLRAYNDRKEGSGSVPYDFNTDPPINTRISLGGTDYDVTAGERGLLDKYISVGKSDVTVDLPSCSVVQSFNADGTLATTTSNPNPTLNNCASLYGLNGIMFKVLNTIQGVGFCNCAFKIVKHGTACWFDTNLGPGKNAIQIEKASDLTTYLNGLENKDKKRCVPWGKSHVGVTGGYCLKKAGPDNATYTTDGATAIKNDGNIAYKINAWVNTNAYIVDEGSDYFVYGPDEPIKDNF